MDLRTIEEGPQYAGIDTTQQSSLPGVTARTQILYQEDTGSALLHCGFEVLGKSFNVCESQFHHQ